MLKMTNSFTDKLIMISMVILMLILIPSQGTKASNKNEFIDNNNEVKQILVIYKDGHSHESESICIRESIKSKLKLSKFRLVKKSKFSNIELIELDDQRDLSQVVQELSQDSRVEAVQANNELSSQPIEPSIKINTYPVDKYFNLQWALNNFGQEIGEIGIPGVDINVLPSWKISKGDQSTIVGVLDTGIDISHIDLRENIYINTNEIPQNGIDDDKNGYIDDVQGWDFLNKDNIVFDSSYEDRHGTAVAGIIAARENTEGIIGVAPNVKILPLKFMNSKGGSTFDAIEALLYAKSLGVKIINCSFGGTDMNSILKKIMKDSGMLFICAAGNNGENTRTNPIYPACFNINNIISVGAINNNGHIAEFSNYGQYVDVVAPGVNIVSLAPDNTMTFTSGTSAAVPHVTGIAALIKSYKPILNPHEIAKIIEDSVVQSDELKHKIKSRGSVSAYNSLKNIKLIH